MNETSNFSSFISGTNYTAPVDIKKLEYIFQVITRYARHRNKALESLHVLEVGCGKGGITFPLTTLGCAVRALDVDSDAVKFVLSEKNRMKIDNLMCTVDNGYKFNVKENFDIVIVSEVLQYVMNPENFLLNIINKMVEGAYLIITIPNGYGPWEMKNKLSPIRNLYKLNFLRRLLGKSAYVIKEGDGYLYYSRKRLFNLLGKFSYKCIHFGKSDSFFIFPLFRKSEFWGGIDIRIADFIPYWLASGWYIIFKMGDDFK